MTENFHKLIVSVAEFNTSVFEERWSNFNVDIANSHISTVLGSLLARQLTLANELLTNPGTWNVNSGALFLRAMGDCFVNFEWISQSANTRALEFINYGIGQEYAQIEHLKSVAESSGDRESLDLAIKARSDWANSQRWVGLTEINLGNWSGSSVRKMAEETGNLDFYNFSYSPFSSVVHSTWQHIGRHNVICCKNPLHKYHLVPYVSESEADFDYVFNSQKYYDKILRSSDKFNNFISKLESPVDYCLKKFEEYESYLRSIASAPEG